MKHSLGTDIGTSHAPADLSRDLGVLMQSLEEHDVYILKEGRKLDEDDPPVVDIILAGAGALLNSGSRSSLEEYNCVFQQLQKQHCIIPVVDINIALNHLPEDPSPTTIPPAPDIEETNASAHDNTNMSKSEREEEEEEEEVGVSMETSLAFGSSDNEPTLSCKNLEDVAFDMDDVEADDDNNVAGTEGDGFTLDDVLSVY
ncbi:hypothetical protein FA15DRAFT_708536 [Coprinopsis marcescibilis]|uniref:Uncharacterized protein n=1 Tax=Coprinopsis marcescibilis TaxID=230819 RepID=A0A5C3KIC1_COPMA|nr:hypothetical protein FA15DRAFT_708536 [Coprinopsis marcescibilis]